MNYINLKLEKQIRNLLKELELDSPICEDAHDVFILRLFEILEEESIKWPISRSSRKSSRDTRSYSG